MEERKSFDLRVHHRDAKTGKIMRANPYVLHISKENGYRFERDGFEFHANGDRVHRVQVQETPPSSQKKASAKGEEK